ncbi:MAG: phosphotransferase [Asgard group archaeon]|nr:phosphotransferase [Asgard group archaeon]
MIMDGFILPYKTKIPLPDKKIQSFIKEIFPNEEISNLSIEESFVNPVYSFKMESGKEYILKINNPYWPSKQEREVFALNFIREKTTIPVPEIIENRIPIQKNKLSYLILEKSPGQDFRSLLYSKKLSSDDILAVTEKCGNYLGQMHTLAFEYFGDMTQQKPSDETLGFFWGRQFQNWPECFREFCLNVLHWVDSNSFQKYRLPLRKKIDYYTSVMPKDETACFVHSDMQPTNVIIENGDISAVIDFEWSYAGSASFDYLLTKAGFYLSSFPSLHPSKMYQDHSDLTREKFDDAFLKGYQTTNSKPLLSLPEELSDFIWLLYMIGSWDWSVQSSTKEDVEKYREAIHTLYSKFKK